MGTRGPQPTPTKILENRGSWRAKINPQEPPCVPGKPKMPQGLSGEAKTIWKNLVNYLDKLGLLSKSDAGQMERYATYLVRWRECERFVAKNGITYPVKCDTPNRYIGKMPDGTAIVGFREYPQVRESHRLNVALCRMESSFGLTPSARSRLAASSADKEDEEQDRPRLADFTLG